MWKRFSISPRPLRQDLHVVLLVLASFAYEVGCWNGLGIQPGCKIRSGILPSAPEKVLTCCLGYITRFAKLPRAPVFWEENASSWVLYIGPPGRWAESIWSTGENNTVYVWSPGKIIIWPPVWFWSPGKIIRYMFGPRENNHLAPGIFCILPRYFLYFWHLLYIAYVFLYFWQVCPLPSILSTRGPCTLLTFRCFHLGIDTSGTLLVKSGTFHNFYLAFITFGSCHVEPSTFHRLM